MTVLHTPAARIERVIDEACNRWVVDRAELLSSSVAAHLYAPRCALTIALRYITLKPMTYLCMAEILGRDRSRLAAMYHHASNRRTVSPAFDAAVGELVAIARGDGL